MVSGSLALLLRCCEVSESRRAAASIGDRFLHNGGKFCLSVFPSICWLEESEYQLRESMAKPEGSEGQPGGSEGRPEGSEG